MRDAKQKDLNSDLWIKYSETSFFFTSLFLRDFSRSLKITDFPFLNNSSSDGIK